MYLMLGEEPQPGAFNSDEKNGKTKIIIKHITKK